MKEISLYDLNENAFNLIGKRCMLITSWNKNKINAMTASWGGLGVLWAKNVVFCFIRKSRYTFEILNKSDFASICVLPQKSKGVLKLCGEKSGRDFDKIKEAKLEVINDENFKYFKESEIVFCCKKLYSGFLDDSNFSENILKNYQSKDFHKMFVFEIKKAMTLTG